MNPKKGQASVEYILLAVISVGVILFAQNYFKDQDIIARFFKSQDALSVNKRLANMLEFGTWAVGKDVQRFHPNRIDHHGTEEPKP